MMTATPAERAILDRICRHPNAGRFHSPILPDNGRYYLAHSPKGKAAVLRLKDQSGFDEWRTRRWTNPRLFPDPPPTIIDVTPQVLEALESSLCMSFNDFQKTRTWVDVEDGFRFLIGDRAPTTARRALPLWNPVEGSAPGIALAFQDAPRDWNNVVPPSGMPFQNRYGSVYFTPHRAFIWRGAPPVPHAPIAGGPIDGVCTLEPSRGNYASPGKPVTIEAGGAFDEDAILECDAEGRAVARSAGVGVLRALERATSGGIVWAVFTSGR